MKRFVITIYKQSFMVRWMFNNDKNIILAFADKLTEYEFVYNHRQRRTIKVAKASYIAKVPRANTVGFLLVEYEDFFKYLEFNRIDPKDVEVNTIDFNYDTAISNLDKKENTVPREDQLLIEEHINAPYNVRVVPVQMGVGKTLISLYHTYSTKKRMSLTAEASHIGSWIFDGNKFFNNFREECILVGGKKNFVKLIELAKSNQLNCSFIIFTQRTMSDYLSEYEETGNSTYGCIPRDLYKVLGVHTRIVDECHKNLHFQFRHTILTSCNKVVYLSATINSNNNFTNKLYELIFPITARYTSREWEKYIDVVGIGYFLKNPKKAQYKGHRGYSHNKLEEWIMSDKETFNNYMNLILIIVKSIYLNSYQKGQTLLIYCSRTEFCYKLRMFLQKEIPHLRVHDYTAEHDESVLHNNDILITTIQKTGESKNVPGLMKVLATVAIDAKEKNIQMIGRLRKPPPEFKDMIPTYYYLVCLSLDVHMKYHERKVRMLTPLVRQMSVTKINNLV